MGKQIILRKGNLNTLIPVDQQGADYIQALKPGQQIRADLVKARNLKFHGKFFSLLTMAFEYWEPELPVYKGQVAEKNFEKFRSDVTVMAGYYDVVANMRGEVQLIAKSISFANMDDTEFQELYKAVFNVLWKKVMIHISGWTESEMERVVNGMMSYG